MTFKEDFLFSLSLEQTTKKITASEFNRSTSNLPVTLINHVTTVPMDEVARRHETD